MCTAKDFNITEKEFLFCQEYIACHLNQTQAYVNVFGTKNRNSARTKASQLLAKVNIQACKDQLLAEMTFNKKAIINQAIQNLINIANGTIDEEKLIQVGNQQKKITTKSQLRDRINATELLMKLYGAFEDTTNNDADEEMQELKEIKENTIVEVEGLDEDK